MRQPQPRLHQIHNLGHAIRVAIVATVLHNEPAVADGAGGLVQPQLQRRRRRAADILGMYPRLGPISALGLCTREAID